MRQEGNALKFVGFIFRLKKKKSTRKIYNSAALGS